MEDQWRLGARIVALLHLLLILIGLAIVITEASLRLHAHYTERAEVESDTNSQISFGGLRSPPDQFEWLNLVTDSTAKSRVIRSSKNKIPFKIPKLPTRKPRKSGFGGIGFGPGWETATEESTRTSTIWVLWLFITLWIISSGVELWATILMLMATKPSTEIEINDRLWKFKIWLIVTPIASILGIVTFALAAEYIVLGIHMTLRAIFLVVICLYMLQVKSHVVSNQSAEMDKVIVDQPERTCEK